MIFAFYFVPLRDLGGSTLSVDFEDDIAFLCIEAVPAGETGFLLARLFLARQAVGSRVAFDERDSPALGWERHGGIRGSKDLSVRQGAKFLELWQQVLS